MRRLALFGLMLLLPNATQAAFTTPAQALDALRATGSAREFSAEAYNHYDGTHFAMWLKGVQEGKGEWLKMRMDVTTHMRRENDLIKMNMRFLVYRNTLYFTVKDAVLTTEDNMVKAKLETMLKKWVAMPAGSLDTASGFFFIDAIAASGMDAVDAAAVWKQVMKGSGNLSVDREGYAGGDAYSLSPAATNDPNLNLHIRVNTKKDGTFEFGKFYVSNGVFIFQGAMQPHAGALNLDIPTATVTPEAFRIHQLGFEFPIPYEPGPDLFDIGNSPEMTEETAPPFVGVAEPEIPETRSYVEYIKRSGVSQETAPDCAYPGTLDAVELDRKGICPGRRYERREIRAIANEGLSGQDLRLLRIGKQRIVDSFDSSATKFETYASERKMHLAKALLSRATLEEIGSTEINRWLLEDVIPFFVSSIRTWIVDYILITDVDGNEGIALEKMAMTESGKRKNFVFIIFNDEESLRPAITDIFLDAKLGDLRANGLLDRYFFSFLPLLR